MFWTVERTQQFVVEWNQQNGYKQGTVNEPNMRTDEAGMVYWNIYDSPYLSLDHVTYFKDKYT